MNPSGRPPKLTPELQETICKVLHSGCYFETAAAFVGLDKTTLFRWLRRGAARKRGRYWRFRIAVRRALAQSEVRDLLRIDRAAETDWRAAAHRLARRYPKRWGRGREQLDATAAQPSAQESARRLREFLAAADAMESKPDAPPAEVSGDVPPPTVMEESA